MTDRPAMQAASLVLNSPAFDLPPFRAKPVDYLICSTPRSGSTLLAALLRGCGLMGIPHEHLSARVHMPILAQRLQALAPDGSVDYGLYIERLRQCRTSPNGVFGMKAHFDQMQAHLAAPPVAQFVAGASLIRIRRRDRLAQAISLCRALATGLWSVASSAPASVVREPDYDGAAIERCLVGIQAQENDWDRFLADSGRAARELWYEDLIALTDAVCHAACAAVGVNPPMMFDLAQSGLRKVASGTADEWMLRYRTEGRAGV